MQGVYFETQRWLIEKLFGWRGDTFEIDRFRSHYHRNDTQIVACEGADIGWMTIVRSDDAVDLHSIYLGPAWQRRGIGTFLITQLIDEATIAGKPLTLSTAKINPALQLYTRLGFRRIGEDEFKLYLRCSR